MKIEMLLTIRLTPESRGEMIDSFAGSYRQLREDVEAEIAKGDMLQIPTKATEIRWLLESGRWD